MEKIFAEAAKKGGKSVPERDGEQVKDGEAPKKKLPKGVVLGKDGKPCRTCTPFADWVALTKQKVGSPSSSSSSTPTSLPPTAHDDCPPDVATLGHSTWTLLHTMSATYPTRASPTQQSEMRQFLSLFSKLYPCWVCADDFRAWMTTKGNEPRVEGQEGLGRWMCEAHNEVNRKLGKGEFDCARWRERWKDGWADGRCG